MGSALRVKKPTDLRENLFETLQETSEGRKFLIHHKSGTAVLQGEAEYLDLLDQIETLKSINRGLQDCVDGKTHPHESVKGHLRSHAARKRKK